MSRVVGPSGIASTASYHRVALLGAEVGAGEDLLHAEDLHALAPGLLDQRHVLGDVRLADGVELLGRGAGVGGLDQAALDDSGHVVLSRFWSVHH